jgi:hypothetical protein
VAVPEGEVSSLQPTAAPTRISALAPMIPLRSFIVLVLLKRRGDHGAYRDAVASSAFQQRGRGLGEPLKRDGLIAS